MATIIKKSKRNDRPSYIKQRIAKVKEVQETIQSLCDNESSSTEDALPLRRLDIFVDSENSDCKSEKSRDIVPKSKKRKVSKSFNDETAKKLQNKTKYVSSSSSGETDIDYSRMSRFKNHRGSKEDKNTKKGKDKNRDAECSDSESEGREKSVRKRERKRTTSKSIEQNFVSLHKEEADSSSGKEFQKSKFSRGGSLAVKKLSEKIVSDSSSSKRSTDKIAISKEQSFRFKSRMAKIMNKFKEVCSEYELLMEHMQWKHIKKDLKYEESASKIVHKSKDVINKLRMELESQEEYLGNFYHEWRKNCTSKNSDHEDSSLSEREASHKLRSKEKSDKSENESIVSEYDNGEIFSENDKEFRKREDKKDKKEKLSKHTEKSKKSDSEDSENILSVKDGVNSPILGCGRGKEMSDEVSDKILDSSVEMVDENKKSDEVRHKRKTLETVSIVNDTTDSAQDIFDETIDTSADSRAANKDKSEEQSPVESEKVDHSKIIPESDSNTDKNLLETGESGAEDNKNSGVEDNNKSGAEDKISGVEDKNSGAEDNKDSDTEENKDTGTNETEPASCQETSESTPDDHVTVATDKDEEHEDEIVNELEELAKRAILESDSDSSVDEESSILLSKTNKNSDVSMKDNEKEKTVRQAEEKRVEINKGEKNTAKSNSLHVRSSLDEDEIAKVEVCAKRILLDSNSDDSTNPSCSTKASSDKKRDSSDNSENVRARAALLDSSNSESSSSDSSKPKSSKTQKKGDDKDTLKDKTVSNTDNSLLRRRSIRHTRTNKNHNVESDEKLRMSCRVVVERLSEEVLKKYSGALKKSKHYLECKKLKSLIDLEKLKRNQNNLSNSLRSSPSKKKNKAAKETEDSLLNHLQKVENGQIVEDAGGSNSDTDRTNGKAKAGVQTNDELMMEADRATKKILLNSSDSDVEDRKIASESNDSESEKSKSTSKDSSRKSLVKLEKDPINKESNEDDWEKNKWRRNKLLTMKLSSDSDSEAAREKWKQKQKELSEKAEESETENSAVKDKVTRRKRRFRRKILDSDSDVQLVNSDSNSDSSVILKDEKSSDTESSVGKQKKSRKRKTRKSSDSDSSLGEKKSKPKRKRIKKVASDSDDSDDQMTNSQGTPGKKGRKNIRKVMKDNKVADDTKQAAKEEEERLKRIAERQKIYNEMYEARLAGEEKVDKLVLDFDPETKEELVSVDENLVKRLKPHQAKGIKFMWDACFESLEMTKSSNGSGCIIAHCMGLGKTLQVIALTHTLLTHEETGVKTVMVVCPLSTVLNWLNEFGLWLKDVKHGDDIEIYTLTKYKKNLERKYQLESWQRTGGVLIIGYEMFRNLSGTNNKMRKNMKEAVLKYLVDPGPDVIVCDEGHLLKNEDTALNKCMTRIRTLRRIVLTGTPLQNNLIEYHCMVQFVKPSLLGTKKEFLNRFVNPITNGQFDDSTEGDVKLMKKRAYVLHKMLKGCVQRFDYSVLMPFLPPKQEYVIFVSLTEVQSNMYQFYLDNLARRLRSTSGSLFADFQSLQRIWTHPVVLRLNAEKVEKMNEKKFTSSDSEGSLKDFIDDDSEANSNTSKTTTEDDDDEVQAIEYNNTRSRRKNNNAEEEVIPKVEEKEEKKDEEWWLQFVQPEHFEDMRISAKLLLLFGILKECEQIGDKVLVFSQSLYSLTLIEQFLEKIDNETQSGTNSELIDGHSGSWLLGSDYFRLDGQTPAENRNTWCKIFNRPSNTRARLFLISTRAGGLGINLTAANRVIIFDASWNPSHDVQSIFRIYRFGQKKPCYVYRFLASGTMEEKIYNRQVTKLSLSCRVVDEQQIERHYSNNDLTELYKFEPSTNPGEKPTLNLPKDRLLAEIFLKYKDFVENYHEHDSLLENKAEEELNEEERKQAWLEYEEEKKGKPPMSSYQAISIYPNSMIMNNVNLPASMNFAMDYEKLQELIRKDYPNATPECQQMMTARVLQDMYSYWEQQSYHSTSANQLLNQNTAMKQAQMRPQVSNVVQIPRVVQRPNTNISGQAKDVLPFTFTNADPKTTDGDDDIVEVPATPVASKNKNQEE